MDELLIFLAGAMVGQIIMVVGLHLWDRWDDEKDRQAEEMRQEMAGAYWVLDETTNTWRLKDAG